MSWLEGADAPVPAYTTTDNDGFMDFINNGDNSPIDIDLHLPLTKYPSPLPPNIDNAARSSSTSSLNLDLNDKPNNNSPHIQKERRNLQCKLIRLFFDAIRSKKTDLVTKLVTNGFVSPDVPNEYGLTPLLAAVEAGDGAMVCTLQNLGADLNAFGIPTKRSTYYYRYSSSSSSSSRRKKGKQDKDKLPPDARTPLMLASSTGNLALAKLLLRDFKADDSLIAGDGQLALRLAADAGHSEIVDLLPSRRGGEFRRWRTHHAAALSRVKRAGRVIFVFFAFFVYYVPRTMLWSLPKHCVVKPGVKLAKWSWENRQQFGGWCQAQVKKMPERVERGVKDASRAVKSLKHVPRGVARFVEALAKGVWKFVTRIPGAMKVMCLWIWESLKKVGVATGMVFLKVVSALHTAVMALLSFFRNITLKDVGNGIAVAVKALFVDLPKAVWSGMKAFGNASYKALGYMLGFLGKVLWWILRVLFEVAVFLPRQLWKILAAIGSSMAKGYHEILVWLNPKRR